MLNHLCKNPKLFSFSVWFWHQLASWLSRCNKWPPSTAGRLASRAPASTAGPPRDRKSGTLRGVCLAVLFLFLQICFTWKYFMIYCLHFLKVLKFASLLRAASLTSWSVTKLICAVAPTWCWTKPTGCWIWDSNLRSAR